MQNLFIIQPQDCEALILIYSVKEIQHFDGNAFNIIFTNPNNFDLPQMTLENYINNPKKDFIGSYIDIYYHVINYFADKESKFFNYIDTKFADQFIVNKFLTKYGNMHRTVPKQFKNEESMKIAFSSCPTLVNYEKIPRKYKTLSFNRFAYKINKSILRLIDKKLHASIKKNNYDEPNNVDNVIDEPIFNLKLTNYEYQTPFPWIAFPFESSYFRTRV